MNGDGVTGVADGRRSLTDHGRVQAVNVGLPREVARRGGTVRTAIFKAPVAGRIVIGDVNVEGDGQADREHHGGHDKGVYAYAREDLDWWAEQLDRQLEPGVFGENLTLTGVDVTHAEVGGRWRVGTSVLEVTMPRTPCYKLGIRMDDQGFVHRFAAATRPGAYLAVVSVGEVAAGDDVDVIARPDHGVTIAAIASAAHHRGAGLELLEQARRRLRA